MLISKEKLKKLLVEPGYLEEVDFDRAAEEANAREVEIPLVLSEKGYIKDENLGRIIADEVNCEYVNLKRVDLKKIVDEMLDQIPEVVAHAQKTIIYYEDDEVMKVATCKPENYTFFKFLEQKAGKEVQVYYSTPFDIGQILKKYKGDMRSEIRRIIKELGRAKVKKEENVVEFVDVLIEYANNNAASDVHIEPLSEECVVRFRVDGSMNEVARYPKNIHTRIVSRIKILAELRTDERAAAQDGKFQFKIDNLKIDVRVSIMPTTGGENVVMRLLTQQGKRFSMEELGLSKNDFSKLSKAIKKPYGMIVVVGPTGSGKTTTLYSVLQTLNSPDVNIMTIEDPTEYNIEGVQQTQVNPAKEITFPKGLRYIVRQDPDIIMVGEIRDEETVDMALNSAMTGHLVLSTMHANDSATTFPRFLEMKAEPFLVSSSVNVCIAQRLVKTICDECKESYFLSEEDITALEEDEDMAGLVRKMAEEEDLSKIRFYRGKGCKFCDDTGYFGRTAIFEVLEITEGIKSLIINKESSDKIKRTATEEGMTTMVEDGIVKSLMGLTTLKEVKKAAKA